MRALPCVTTASGPHSVCVHTIRPHSSRSSLHCTHNPSSADDALPIAVSGGWAWSGSQCCSGSDCGATQDRHTVVHACLQCCVWWAHYHCYDAGVVLL